MSTTATMASFTHDGLAASILVPDDWEAEEVNAQTVRFYAPELTDHDGHRPTMSFAHGEPDGFGEEWFDLFCTAARERLEAYEGFHLLRHERYTLSSLVPVDATWYEWSPEPGTTFAQVQALVPVDANRMYLVNAATPAGAADRMLPLFDQVLRSLRVLPVR